MSPLAVPISPPVIRGWACGCCCYCCSFCCLSAIVLSKVINAVFSVSSRISAFDGKSSSVYGNLPVSQYLPFTRKSDLLFIVESGNESMNVFKCKKSHFHHYSPEVPFLRPYYYRSRMRCSWLPRKERHDNKVSPNLVHNLVRS